MSPFTIFAIVLTIAYILYYATIISMDLNSKSKDAEKATETISANDSEEETPGIMSRNVIEDTVSGGFNITESTITSDGGKEEASEHEEEITEVEMPFTSLSTGDDKVADIVISEEESQEDNDISTVPFAGNASDEDVRGNPFEEADAFNPDLAQPQYGVSAIVGNPVDAAVQKNVDELNRTLLTNTRPKGTLKTPEELAHIMQANRKNSNIDYHDEFTQC